MQRLGALGRMLGLHARAGNRLEVAIPNWEKPFDVSDSTFWAHVVV